VKLHNLATSIINNLVEGEEIPRLWILYFSFGAITFGMLSYPFHGAAFILIPMFIFAGLFGLLGCFITLIDAKTLEDGKIYVNIGMSLMVVASWTRAVLVWGLEQHGVGNNIIASVVWVWITIGALFLLIAVSQRGLR
jgi:hypothetical protein